MYNQNNPTGQEARGFQPSAGKQKEEPVNKVQLIGTILPKSSNENDPITFYPFRNGGGAVHCNLKVSEYTGADENGNPKYINTYIPIDITVNKIIPAATLQGLVSGMKVKVVGTLRIQSYEKKGTQQKVSTLCVKVYSLNILEAPMAAYAPPQNYAGMPYPPQQPYYPPQQPYYQPQGGYPPQPPMGGAPGYNNQPQAAPQAPVYQQHPGTAPQHGQAPAYTSQQGQQPQGGYPQAPQGTYPPQQAPVIDDLPLP